ncbi:14992_t:CDS:2 [Dentiscutata heterogama]|uniref:14992_t:CDS:1 n=1 Tax=Dentiscutata heterogama TaxID=1316150 RepID=A0ACA9LSC5_9GLOM|nr:14992_t:CDS:2 [Dentiscutata heterogama]
MSPPRRTRKVYGVEKTPGHRFKCPSSGCHCSFVKYERLEKHLQDIHLTTIQGIRHNQNARQIQRDYDSIAFSFKNNMCKQLDEIYEKLEIAENKYLPLTEYEYPQIGEFRQCRNSITLLKVEISRFNEKQIRLINSILVNKVAAEEKEKVATLVKKLREEIKLLMNELNKKNKKIKELEEKYIALNAKYHALKKDHDTGDGHYMESRQFFEEAEATNRRNRELENNLHLLEQQNVELSKEIEELTNKKATLSEVVYIID